MIDTAIGWTASGVRDKVLTRPRTMRVMTYISASVFLALAVVVGFDGVRTLTG